MSAPLELVTDAHVEVKDYLAESLPLTGKERAARYRRRKQASKVFECGTLTNCDLCGVHLLTKWGTLRGTTDVAKAICNDCKVIKETRKQESTCSHPHLKQFTFTDGQTIKTCPDCNEFDGKRRRVLMKTTCGPTHKLAKQAPIGTAGYKVSASPLRGFNATDFRKTYYYKTDATGKPVKVDITQNVVVPFPSTNVVGPLPEWQIERDERDHQSLDCVYDYPKLYKKVGKTGKLTDELRIEGFTSTMVGIGFASFAQPSQRCSCFKGAVTRHIEGGWEPNGLIWTDGRWYGDFRSRRWVTTRVFVRTVQQPCGRWCECQGCLNEGKESKQL